MGQDSISLGIVRSTSVDETINLIRSSHRVVLTLDDGVSGDDCFSGVRCEMVNKIIGSVSNKYVETVLTGFFLYVTPVSIRVNQNGAENIYPYPQDVIEIFLDNDREEALNKITPEMIESSLNKVKNNMV